MLKLKLKFKLKRKLGYIVYIYIYYITYNKQLSILSFMTLAFLFDLNLSQSLSRQRVFRDKLNPIDVYNDIEFVARYRVTKYMLVQLQEKVVTFLHRSTIRSHSIPAPTQLAVTLQLFTL